MTFIFTPSRIGTYIARIDSETGLCSVTGPNGDPIEVRVFESITPDGAVGRAHLGVFAWRMLDELRAPLHRRVAMAQYWARAMQPYYYVQNHEAGRPAHSVPGNQAGVLAAFALIRKAAGDFDSGDLDVN